MRIRRMKPILYAGMLVLILGGGFGVGAVYSARVNREAELVRCVFHHDVACVQGLLRSGVDPDVPTYHDKKPMRIAIEHKDFEMLKILLSAQNRKRM